VTGDEVYGRDAGLRTFLEGQHTGYVLKVPCSFRITLPSGQKIRADHAARLAPAKAWQTASAGYGSKGERDYSWAWLATASPRRHLLIRRNLGDPADLAYFLCHVPADRACSLTNLIRVAGRRWPVEEDFRLGKNRLRPGRQPGPPLHRPDQAPGPGHGRARGLRHHRGVSSAGPRVGSSTRADS
jgi:hypothetical protein